MTTVEKAVEIKIISTIHQIDQEKQTYELWLQGSFHKKSNKMYLRYEEFMEEKKVKTTLKMGNKQALILRGGDLNMRLPFHISQTEHGHYDTKYGFLPLQTKTNRLEFHHFEDNHIKGTFHVEYDLFISGQPVGKYKLEIQYTEGQA